MEIGGGRAKRTHEGRYWESMYGQGDQAEKEGNVEGEKPWCPTPDMAAWMKS